MQFVVGAEALEYVNQYKYLGVNISNTGKFSVAEKNLSLKASRALFSIKQSIFNKTLKPSAILNIFDALVKPIALYGCEVWSAYKPSFQTKSIDELFELSFKSTNDFDKVHTRFCKFVLGTHSKASNFAVYSELGQFPLLITILTSCLNFWLHIIQSNRDTLLSKAYMEQINSSMDKSRWALFIKNILHDLGFSHVWNNHSTFNSFALLNSIKHKLKERYISFWYKRLSGDEGMRKLRTYKILKQNFGRETYIEDIYDKDIRKCICSLRISTHKLRIERGRYCGETVENRLCTVCNEIETEVHFLCQCQKYKSLRGKMFESIYGTNCISVTDPDALFYDLLTSQNKNILKAVGKFIQDCSVT